MSMFLLLLFIGFHSFIFIFPRVVFTKNVNPSQRQLMATRMIAFCLIVFVMALYYYYS